MIIYEVRVVKKRNLKTNVLYSKLYKTKIKANNQLNKQLLSYERHGTLKSYTDLFVVNCDDRSMYYLTIIEREIK